MVEELQPREEAKWQQVPSETQCSTDRQQVLTEATVECMLEMARDAALARRCNRHSQEEDTDTGKQECKLDENCPAAVWRNAQNKAAETPVQVQECERLWKEVYTLMSDRADPEEVQRAADAALELTAQCWQFEPSHAIEAVIIKIESQTPLTFACPATGTLVRYASTSEGQWHNIAAKLRGEVKAQQKAVTGSSGYTKEVT